MASPFLEFYDMMSKAPKIEKILMLSTVTSGFPKLELVLEGIPLYSDDILISSSLINNLNTGDRVLLAKVEGTFILLEKVVSI